jgi:hypothetical protein
LIASHVNDVTLRISESSIVNWTANVDVQKRLSEQLFVLSILIIEVLEKLSIGLNKFVSYKLSSTLGLEESETHPIVYVFCDSTFIVDPLLTGLFSKTIVRSGFAKS